MRGRKVSVGWLLSEPDGADTAETTVTQMRTETRAGWGAAAPDKCKSVILIPTERHGAKLWRLLPEETSNTVRNENVRGDELLGAGLLVWSARHFSTCYPSRRVLRGKEEHQRLLVRRGSYSEWHISEACGKRLKKWRGWRGRDDAKRWATVKVCRRKTLPGAQCWVTPGPESFGFEKCSQSSSCD